MAEEEIKRRLAAIMSADVKDYTRLMREDETSTVRTLTAYREIMTTLVQQHHGRVVDAPGDNILAEFPSVVDAVQCAVAIQRELKARNAEFPDDRKMEFRMGINLGDVIVKGDRIYGDGVNIASRLEGLADPGGICISRTAYDQIEDKLPFGYEYLGERRVKNVVKPVRAYKVLLEPEETARRERQEEAYLQDEDEHFRHFRREKRPKRRDMSKARFYRHLRSYLIVMAFLLIIDLLTGGGFWFYWPALGWGFGLFMHWNRSVAPWSRNAEEGDREPGMADRGRPEPDGKLRYVRIQVEPKGGGRSRRHRVNIRIPLRLIRTGVKLSSALPEHARKRIRKALKKADVDFDLFSLKGEKLEEALESLGEGGIEVDAEDKIVRISCE